MNGNALLILSDYFAMDILKDQTTMVPAQFYDDCTQGPHRQCLLSLHIHAGDTDIKKVGFNFNVGTFYPQSYVR